MTSVSVGILKGEKDRMGFDVQEICFGEPLMKER